MARCMNKDRLGDKIDVVLRSLKEVPRACPRTVRTHARHLLTRKTSARHRQANSLGHEHALICPRAPAPMRAAEVARSIADKYGYDTS